MLATNLSLTDTLPLTCSRSGTCCHGKAVWLNPWELAQLATAKEQTPQEFRDKHTDFGGIRLLFDGSSMWKGLSACTLYTENFGCSVHNGRPLACRLYPLGRKREGVNLNYIYQGSQFPCLAGCPEVTSLPQMSVSDYIADQKAASYEEAQDVYLDLVQDLADGAFALLLESGLSESGDTNTLKLWQTMGSESPQKLTKRISQKWLSELTTPSLSSALSSSDFCTAHHDLLQAKLQESFTTLTSLNDFHKASCLMMSLALHLARSVGAHPKDFAKYWIATAKEHGALE